MHRVGLKHERAIAELDHGGASGRQLVRGHVELAPLARGIVRNGRTRLEGPRRLGSSGRRSRCKGEDEGDDGAGRRAAERVHESFAHMSVAVPVRENSDVVPVSQLAT